MPDLICPPLSSAEPWCPCRPVRLGAGLLTMCAYSAAYAPVFFDKTLSAVVGHVLRGDIPLGDQPFIWAGAAAFGALMMVVGVHRVRTEGHGFKPGSFLWSLGVVAFASWLLANYIGPGLTYTALGDQVARMLLIAWAASNASNIVLQLVEVWRRRPRVRRQPAWQPIQQPSGLLHRRTVTAVSVEQIETEHLLAAGRSATAPDSLAADLLEHLGDVPLIDLVPMPDGSLIPRDLPQGEAVPVRRRR